jgi:hypothetical protein
VAGRLSQLGALLGEEGDSRTDGMTSVWGPEDYMQEYEQGETVAVPANEVFAGSPTLCTYQSTCRR